MILARTQTWIRNTGNYAFKMVSSIKPGEGWAGRYMHLLDIPVTPGTEFEFAYYFPLKLVSYVGYVLEFSSNISGNKTGFYYSLFAGWFVNTTNSYAVQYYESILQWHKHRVNIYEDYRKAFGFVPPDLRITSISMMMGDPYHLDRLQTAYFDSIRIINRKINHPPEKPSQVDGVLDGWAGHTYVYSVNTSDIDGDHIRFYFNCSNGDGKWSRWVSSGERVFVNFTWQYPGDYTIRVIAEDEEGAKSEWSDSIVVHIEGLGIRILSPNGGETFQINGDMVIRWSSIGDIGENVEIDLIKDGTIVEYITLNTSNDGVYRWIIPSYISPGLNYSIRAVSVSYPTVYDSSDSAFYIIAEASKSLIPDLSVTSRDIKILDRNPSVNQSITIYAYVWNLGDVDANATVNFYFIDSNGTSEKGYLFNSTTIMITKQDRKLCIAKGVPPREGEFYINIEIVDSTPDEKNLKNNLAQSKDTIIVRSYENSFNLIIPNNTIKVKEQSRKLICVNVLCYYDDLQNVCVNVIGYTGDINVTVVTPPRDVIANKNYEYYIKVETPKLPNNISYYPIELKIEARGIGSDGSTLWYSDVMTLDIGIYRVKPSFGDYTFFSIILGGFLAFLTSFTTESGRYRLFAYIALLLPLFTRISRNEVLENFVRGQIYGYIKSHPGVHYSKIRKNLGIGNGTLAHHLYILEKTGLIKSKREGLRYRLFYPTGMSFPESERYMLSELQISILNIIEENKGITQKEIVSILQEKQQTISYNLRVLEKAGMIVYLKKKGRKHYYISNRDSNWKID
ncbi:MAG TPA: MarR family transcriptional regulator [Thermoplasmatales archaeon]|nr:MarR family transcriptional regulator [Thermoplasmatales archaeon]